MTDKKQSYEEFTASVDWSAEGIRLEDDPKAMLGLPEGLLAIEGLPVAFAGALAYPVTEAKTLEAAQHIIDNRPEGAEPPKFHSRASVMAHASQEYGWLTGPDMRLCAIPNYMHLPSRPEAQKAAQAAEMDMLIDVLRSGILTTREGARKAFPDMDVDAIWDKHEAAQKEAVEAQKRRMDEAQGKQGAADDGKSWAKTEQTRRSSRTNPCLGM